jgi:serine protease inhibitor
MAIFVAGAVTSSDAEVTMLKPLCLFVAASLLLGFRIMNVTAQPAKDADMLSLVTGNSEFALALNDQLARKDGNLFFSPYSISTALAMTYAGARGKTADEMRNTLRLHLEPNQLHPAFFLENPLEVAAGRFAVCSRSGLLCCPAFAMTLPRG